MGGSEDDQDSDVNSKLNRIERIVKSLGENLANQDGSQLNQKVEDLQTLITESQEYITSSQDISKATILTQLNKVESVLNLISEKVLTLSQDFTQLNTSQKYALGNKDSCTPQPIEV